MSTDAARPLVLPYPPPTNRLYRADRGVVHLSAEGEAYHLMVAVLAHAAGLEPLAGPVALTVHVYRPRKAGDLDGRLKALLDALQGTAYGNDAQIVELHAYRHDDKQRPRAEVTVAPAGGDQA